MNTEGTMESAAVTTNGVVTVIDELKLDVAIRSCGAPSSSLVVITPSRRWVSDVDMMESKFKGETRHLMNQVPRSPHQFDNSDYETVIVLIFYLVIRCLLPANYSG